MDQTLILKKLQERLKERQMTYSRLGEEMGLSLPAIKRIFSKQQITFENLIRICNLLGLSLSDLFHEVEQDTLKVFRFTEEQEFFFAAHPHYLAYFYQIRARKSPTEIRRKFLISEKSNLKYLKRLKNFGLIKLEGASFVSTVKAPIFWEDEGPLGKIFSRLMINELVNRVLSAGSKPETLSSDLKNFILTKNQRNDFIEDINKILKAYQSLSSQNSKLKKKTQIALTSFFVSGERQMNLFDNIIDV